MADWDRLNERANCPFCEPALDRAPSFLRIAEFSNSSLFLAWNQTYRGTCTLRFKGSHVSRIDQLSLSEWATLASDLYMSQAAVFRAIRPDHINVESLGNGIPHLHWHLIPRYRKDGRWGGPIWTTHRDEMIETVLEEAEYRGISELIGEQLRLLAEAILPDSDSGRVRTRES